MVFRQSAALLRRPPRPPPLRFPPRAPPLPSPPPDKAEAGRQSAAPLLSRGGATSGGRAQLRKLIRGRAATGAAVCLASLAHPWGRERMRNIAGAGTHQPSNAGFLASPRRAPQCAHAGPAGGKFVLLPQLRCGAYRASHMRWRTDSIVARMTIGRTRASEFGGGEIRDQLQMGIGGVKEK